MLAYPNNVIERVILEKVTSCFMDIYLKMDPIDFVAGGDEHKGKFYKSLKKMIDLANIVPHGNETLHNLIKLNLGKNLEMFWEKYINHGKVELQVAYVIRTFSEAVPHEQYTTFIKTEIFEALSRKLKQRPIWFVMPSQGEYCILEAAKFHNILCQADYYSNIETKNFLIHTYVDYIKYIMENYNNFSFDKIAHFAKRIYGLLSRERTWLGNVHRDIAVIHIMKLMSFYLKNLSADPKKGDNNRYVSSLKFFVELLAEEYDFSDNTKSICCVMNEILELYKNIDMSKYYQFTRKEFLVDYEEKGFPSMMFSSQLIYLKKNN